ncbi:hypothetical protein [Xenophilus sp.]
MGSANQRVLVKRFAEVTGYSENAAHHQVENDTGTGLALFDDRRGGAA